MKKTYLTPEMEQLQFTTAESMAAQDNDISGTTDLPGFGTDE